MLPLDPKHFGFSWANARACAERCSMAYAETASSLRIKNIAGKSVWNTQTDTEALVLPEPDCICVAFRGSTNLRDWIQDFKAAKHPRSDLIYEPAGEVVQVHTGFMEDVESVSEDLTHALRNLSPADPRLVTSAPTKPIFITGHSKGGAEAILFALELQRQNFPIAGVYTFGQPRVGNCIFRNIYNATLYEETFHMINENDIVPRLPGWLMGYRHCGQEIFLPVGSGWDLNPPLWVKLLSDASGLWSAWRQHQDVLVAEHNLANYQRRIQLV
jgi:triacylglycerol lipase